MDQLLDPEFDPEFDFERDPDFDPEPDPEDADLWDEEAGYAAPVPENPFARFEELTSPSSGAPGQEDNANPFARFEELTSSPANTSQDGTLDGDTLAGRGTPRIKGYDAPEYQHRGQSYEPGALTSERYLQNLNAQGASYKQIGGEGEGKYDRRLVEGSVNGRPLEDVMIQAGMGVPLGREQNEQTKALETASFLRRTDLRNNDPWDQAYAREIEGRTYDIDLDRLNGDSVKPEGAWSRAIDRGLGTFRADIGGAIDYIGRKFDSDAMQSYGQRQMRQGDFKAAMNPASVESWDAAMAAEDTFSKIGTYWLEKVGENVAQLGITAASAWSGGTVSAGLFGRQLFREAMSAEAKRAASAQAFKWGARAGAFGPLYGQHLGEAAEEMKRADAPDSPVALLTAGVNAALDYAPMEFIFKGFFKGLRPDMARDLTRSAMRQPSVRAALFAAAGRVGKTMTVVGAFEGATETAQEIALLASNAYVNPNFKWDTPENRQRIKESFIGGTIVGVSMGGASRTVTEALRPFTREQAPLPPPDPGTTGANVGTNTGSGGVNNNTVIPETSQQLYAQYSAVLDPSQAKDTMLVTGSDASRRFGVVASNATKAQREAAKQLRATRVNLGPAGVLYSINPQTIAEARALSGRPGSITEEVLNRWLYDGAGSTTKQGDTVYQAEDEQGNVITQVLADSGVPGQTESARELVEQHTPRGGVAVTQSLPDAIDQRLEQGAGEQQDWEDAWAAALANQSPAENQTTPSGEEDFTADELEFPAAEDQNAGNAASRSVELVSSEQRAQADAAGLTARVTDLYVQGRTTEQVAEDLEPDLTQLGVPAQGHKGFIDAVRASLGIPTRETTEPSAGFNNWLTAYQQRNPAPPAAGAPTQSRMEFEQQEQHPNYDAAVALVREKNSATLALLKNTFNIKDASAQQLMQELERYGVVSAKSANNRRTVLEAPAPAAPKPAARITVRRSRAVAPPSGPAQNSLDEEGKALGRTFEDGQIVLEERQIQALAERLGIPAVVIRYGVALHELGGHIGFDALFGTGPTSLGARIVSRITALAESGDAIAQRAMERTRKAKGNYQDLVGYFAEEAVIAEHRGELTPQSRTIWARIKDAVRRAVASLTRGNLGSGSDTAVISRALRFRLRRNLVNMLGLKPETMSSAEIYTVIRSAAFYALEQKRVAQSFDSGLMPGYAERFRATELATLDSAFNKYDEYQTRKAGGNQTARSAGLPNNAIQLSSGGTGGVGVSPSMMEARRSRARDRGFWDKEYWQWLFPKPQTNWSETEGADRAISPEYGYDTQDMSDDQAVSQSYNEESDAEQDGIELGAPGTSPMRVVSAERADVLEPTAINAKREEDEDEDEAKSVILRDTKGKVLRNVYRLLEAWALALAPSGARLDPVRRNEKGIPYPLNTENPNVDPVEVVLRDRDGTVILHVRARFTDEVDGRQSRLIVESPVENGQSGRRKLLPSREETLLALPNYALIALAKAAYYGIRRESAPLKSGRNEPKGRTRLILRYARDFQGRDSPNARIEIDLPSLVSFGSTFRDGSAFEERQTKAESMTPTQLQKAFAEAVSFLSQLGFEITDDGTEKSRKALTELRQEGAPDESNQYFSFTKDDGTKKTARKAVRPTLKIPGRYALRQYRAAWNGRRRQSGVSAEDAITPRTRHLPPDAETLEQLPQSDIIDGYLAPGWRVLLARFEEKAAEYKLWWFRTFVKDGGDTRATTESWKKSWKIDPSQKEPPAPISFFSSLENRWQGLSNFAFAPFEAIAPDGVRRVYPTVEHYFQAAKFQDNPEYAERIRLAETPLKAKMLGKTRDVPIRKDWDKIKEAVMLRALRAKFGQNPGLMALLESSNPSPLQEASDRDSYWGIGPDGNGKNRLGKLLEKIRDDDTEAKRAELEEIYLAIREQLSQSATGINPSEILSQLSPIFATRPAFVEELESARGSSEYDMDRFEQDLMQERDEASRDLSEYEREFQSRLDELLNNKPRRTSMTEAGANADDDSIDTGRVDDADASEAGSFAKTDTEGQSPGFQTDANDLAAMSRSSTPRTRAALQTGPMVRPAADTRDPRIRTEASWMSRLLEWAGVLLNNPITLIDDFALENAPESGDYNAGLLEQTRQDKPPARVMFMRRKIGTDAEGNPVNQVKAVIYVSDAVQGTRRNIALMHEIGHVVMRHYLATASKASLRTLARTFGEPGSVDFEENFADSWVRFMFARQAAEKEGLKPPKDNPKSTALFPEPIRAMFESMYRALWGAYRAARRALGPAYDQKWEDFIESLVNRRRRKEGEGEAPALSLWAQELYQAQLGDVMTGELIDHGRDEFLDFTPFNRVAAGAVNRSLRRVMGPGSGRAMQTLWDGSKAFYKNWLRALDSKVRDVGTTREGKEVANWLADQFRREAGKAQTNWKASRSPMIKRLMRQQAARRGTRVGDDIRAMQGPFETALRAWVKEHVPNWQPWHGVMGKRAPKSSAVWNYVSHKLVHGAAPAGATLSAADQASAKTLENGIRVWLFQMWRLSNRSGTNIKPRQNYFPRMWSRVKILQDTSDNFVAKVVAWGKTPLARKYWKDTFGTPLTKQEVEKFGRHLRNVLTAGQSAVLEADHAGLSFMGPGFGYKNQRVIPQDLADALGDYLEEDIVEIMTSYMVAAVKRAAFVNRFADEKARTDLQVLMADIARNEWNNKGGRSDAEVKLEITKKIDALIEAKTQQNYGVNPLDAAANLKVVIERAYQQGDISLDDYQFLNDEAIPSYLGQLGADFVIFGKPRPAFRHYASMIMVYETVRTLSMGVLSQTGDFATSLARLPNQDRWNLVKTAFAAAVSGQTRAELRQLSMDLNRWEHRALDHVLGDEQGIQAMGGTARRLQEWFFQVNGMQWLTNWTRAIDLSTGKDAIEAWAKRGATRELAEIGLTVQDVQSWVAAGRPTKWGRFDNVLSGLNQLVDEMILSPNAAMKPRWGNDARLGLTFQLKSFIYTFQLQVLDRAYNQSVARWGAAQGAAKFYAIAPYLALAAFALPMAALAMELRWMISPPKDGEPRGLDYVWETIKRSGVLGLTSIAFDMIETEAHGKISLIAPAGPFAGQLYDLGTRDWWTEDGPSSVLTHALPAYPILGFLHDVTMSAID